MQKVLSLIMMLLSISGCCNEEKSIAQSITNQTAASAIIDTLLAQGMTELLNTQAHAKYDSIPISESCLILRSTINEEDSIIYFSDSTITISYNSSYYKLNNYKGILKVNGFNVAIFDAGGFLSKYYNTDSLKAIPFEQFKQYPMAFIPANTYYIQNGHLHYWNP